MRPGVLGENASNIALIKKVTGRILRRPIEEQEALYSLIESEYRDLVARATIAQLEAETEQYRQGSLAGKQDAKAMDKLNTPLLGLLSFVLGVGLARLVYSAKQQR